MKNKYFISFLIWMIIVVIRFFFYYELYDLLFILSPILGLSLFLMGITILIFILIQILKKKENIIFHSALAGVIVTIIFLCWFTKYGELFGLYSHLLRNESRYLKQVELAKNPNTRNQLQYPTIVDDGTPTRVAFSLGGIIDNWTGIVYDPTGEVMKANQFKPDWSNWNDPKLERIKKLFGGDLMWAYPIWGYWYFCCFT